MAQSVARQAVNLQVAGSNPAGGGVLRCFYCATNTPFLLPCGGAAEAEAALAQLGERQTEDLKVPGSIPGGGSLLWLRA